MFVAGVRYYFVHRILPGFIFKDEDAFLKIFVKNNEAFVEFLHYAWDTAKYNIIRENNELKVPKVYEEYPAFRVYANKLSDDIFMGIIKISESYIFSKIYTLDLPLEIVI